MIVTKMKLSIENQYIIDNIKLDKILNIYLNYDKI